MPKAKTINSQGLLKDGNIEYSAVFETIIDTQKSTYSTTYTDDEITRS